MIALGLYANKKNVVKGALVFVFTYQPTYKRFSDIYIRYFGRTQESDMTNNENRVKWCEVCGYL